MAANSPVNAPVGGSGARSWRTPALVALLVLVIVVVVTFLVRAGNGNSETPAAAGSDSTSTSGDPGSPSTATTSGSASDTASSTAPTAAVPSVAPGVDLDATLKGPLKAKFPALIPSEVPAGWTLVAADWSNGLWTLSFSLPDGGTAEVFQATGSEKKLLKTNLPDAQTAGTVNLKKYGTGTWNAYSGSTGFGLTHPFAGSTALVMGPDQATAVTLAQQLLTAEDGQLTDDD